MKSFKLLVLLAVPVVFFTVLNAYTGEQVRMKDEYVNIRISEDFTVNVRVEFVFENTAGYSGKLAFPGSDWFSYNDFSASWNSSALETVCHQAPQGHFYEINKDRYGSIYTFMVPRAESYISKHVIRYSYKAPHVKFEKDYGAEGYYIEYILRTGALWKGNVSNLRVRVETGSAMSCGKIKYLAGSYTGSCVSANVLEINLKDTDLDRDIRLIYETD